MRRVLRTITALSVSVITLSLGGVVRAGETVPLQNPLTVEDIPSLAGNIIAVVMGFVGSVALLMFIYGGFLWLTSGGSPERIKKGKETLIWAIIGLAFIFSSYIIARFVINAITGRA